MVVANPAHSQHYLESLRLLRELHLLTLAGKDQTEEGDAIRDAMEKPWWRLSEAERQRIEGLSADLYSIGESRAAPAKVPDSIAEAFEVARASANWDEALDVLRRHETEWPAAEVAVLRAIAWEYLGQHDVAFLFFEEAARLEPDSIWLKFVSLWALVRSGQLEEARGRAIRLAEETSDPVELLLAADALFGCAEAVGDELNQHDLRYITDVAERAWRMDVWDARRLGEDRSRVARAGFLSAAISLDLLGEHQRAREASEVAQTLIASDAAPTPTQPEINAGHPGAGFVTSMRESRNQIEAEIFAYQ